MMNEKSDRDKAIETLMSDEKEDITKEFKEDPSLSKYPSCEMVTNKKKFLIITQATWIENYGLENMH